MKKQEWVRESKTKRECKDDLERARLSEKKKKNKAKWESASEQEKAWLIERARLSKKVSISKREPGWGRKGESARESEAEWKNKDK